VWGEFRRTRAKNRGQPRRLLCQEQKPAKKFSFPFRRKKSGARKIKNLKKTFLLAGERQRAAAGRLPLSGSVSRSKKVRAKCIITAPVRI
jgi:hypothetical protein